jgi:hypothetical protein
MISLKNLSLATASTLFLASGIQQSVQAATLIWNTPWQISTTIRQQPTNGTFTTTAPSEDFPSGFGGQGTEILPTVELSVPLNQLITGTQRYDSQSILTRQFTLSNSPLGWNLNLFAFVDFVSFPGTNATANTRVSATVRNNTGANVIAPVALNASLSETDFPPEDNFASTQRFNLPNGNYNLFVNTRTIEGLGPVPNNPFTVPATVKSEVAITFRAEPVPEPLTIFGSTIGLACGALMQRKYSKIQKKAGKSIS